MPDPSRPARSCSTDEQAKRPPAWGAAVLVLYFFFPGAAWGQEPPDPSSTVVDGRSLAPQGQSRKNASGTRPIAPVSQSGAFERQLIHPKARHVPAEYPDGAEGDAVVTLRFVVTAAGAVEEAELVVGDEPFASAALAATKAWSFDPARRGGEALAARIMMDVHFAQDVQEETERRAPSGGPAAQRAAGVTPSGRHNNGRARATVAPQAEVVVAGEREPATTSLSRAEARQIPGALFGDPLRAVDALPGVTTVVSGLPLYYLRGAPPGNVGFFIDEVRIPVLYHAFLGPSVVHPELIERVNLHSSGPPARLGGYSGGAVEAELRSPSYQRSFSGGLGLWSADAAGESGFNDGAGNVFIGGRYALTGLLLSALSSQTLEYWNYQALIDYELSPQDEVRVFALGAFDYLEDAEGSFLGTEFHRLDLKYTHHFGSATRAWLGVTAGSDRTRLSQGQVTDRFVAVRGRVRSQLTKELEYRGGASLNMDFFDLDLAEDIDSQSEVLELFPAREDALLGAFSEFVWTPQPGITVLPSIRVDAFRSLGQTAVGVSPRISARFRLHPQVHSNYAVALAHQPPNYIPSIPGVRVAGLDGGLQRALHTSAGIEAELPLEVEATGSLFHNAFFGLTDPYSLAQDFSLDTDLATRRSLGRAYGLELGLRRPLTHRLGAFISYTLSRTTRSFESTETLAGSDRTHVLNVAAMYTLGANWRAALRGLYYSGVPGKERGQPNFPFSRVPGFFRLDARLERRFRLGPQSWWAIVAEILNATASSETLRRVCNVSSLTGQVACDAPVVAPAIYLPNLKIEARY